MKERKLNPFWHLLVVISLLWLFPGAQGASAQTKVSIANLIVSSSHLPLWIAHEQGLFVRHGIAAEILIVEDASRRISGDIPFGVIGVPAAISAVADGRDLKLLATLDAARVTGHLVARGDIKTPDALRGKRVGVNRIAPAPGSTQSWRWTISDWIPSGTESASSRSGACRSSCRRSCPEQSTRWWSTPVRAPS